MASSYEQYGHIEPNYVVEAELYDKIADQGSINLTDFWDISLYSDEGYYASGYAAIGSGDFWTAPETHQAYGYSVANAIAELAPNDNRAIKIMEMGAGNGTLARQILTKLAHDYPDLYSRCQYIISDRSYGLIQKQQTTLTGLPVTWKLGSAANIVEDDVDFAISNELLDVMAIELVTKTDSGFDQSYVTINESGNFVLARRPISPSTYQHLGNLSIAAIPPGTILTVSPTRLQWLEQMSRNLRPGGHLITSDYATKSLDDDIHTYEPRVYARFLNPPTGHPLEVALEFPGLVDITSSVDMRQLSRHGKAHGLETIYHSTQQDFLSRHNFTEERDRAIEAELYTNGSVDRSAHFYASHLLLAPEHMGDHEVLIQRKLGNAH